MKHSPLRHLEAALRELELGHLRRARPAPQSADAVTFCSNDYLGLAAATVQTSGSPGAAASRLITGERAEHTALEAALAEWLGTESALTFTSGYAANVGLISALAGRGDLIVSDERNHASIIDGARLSRAEIEVVPHLDVAAVEAALAKHPTGRRWVVTEGYFSMDADSPDLPALRAVCDRYDAALLVDEAHSLGVLGPDGRGVAAELGVVPDAVIGTFGKAFGAGGAFVVGSKILTEWLWNRARSFVFSTGLSPLLATCALRGVQLANAHPELRARTLAVAHTLRSALAQLGKPASGYGHIIPVVLGSPAAALEASAALAALGVHAQAIRPPTVASGSSRLRIAASARHSEADVAKVVGAFRSVFNPKPSAT
ncbi:MAG: 8-amino-7-oxononanoate synthase [Polyangiaceae bacterium]